MLPQCLRFVTPTVPLQTQLCDSSIIIGPIYHCPSFNVASITPFCVPVCDWMLPYPGNFLVEVAARCTFAFRARQLPGCMSSELEICNMQATCKQQAVVILSCPCTLLLLLPECPDQKQNRCNYQKTTTLHSPKGQNESVNFGENVLI